jgi:sarcosine oxidase subunit gamma
MADRMAGRRSVLDGLAFPSRVGLASVADAGAASRFIYRGAPEVIGGAFGVELPTTPLRANVADGRAALWLGPDEWLLLAADADGSLLAAALSDSLSSNPASLVEISHRQVGLIVSGPSAEALLNAGCPLDLERIAFPVGTCTRTVLAKAEIVLWRTAADAFRIEVARSFAPYVVAFLDEAMHGIA